MACIVVTGLLFLVEIKEKMLDSINPYYEWRNECQNSSETLITTLKMRTLQVL